MSARVWMKLSEAADYLGMHRHTVASLRTESPDRIPGKIRFRVIQDGARIAKVRLWAEDVRAMLPTFNQP